MRGDSAQAASDEAVLGTLLLRWENQYRKDNRLEFDPVSCLHRYRRAEDAETAAFLIAPLAYGRAAQIVVDARKLLDRLGSSPFDAVVNFRPSRDARIYRRFVHRFTSGDDLRQFLSLTKTVIAEHGRLKTAFLRFDRPEAPIRDAMSAFVMRFRNGAARLRPHVRYMLPDPAEGSACKRFNLFLRWMVRKDDIDLGLWPEIPASKLIIPLDTHVARISRSLGLLKRRSNDWKAAEELTDKLRAFCADDPVRYDFALAHLGISGDWRKELVVATR